jgi:hypothetical protein
MKKLLCIALFSMTIMTNAANELLPKNVTGVKIENDISKTIKTENSNIENETIEVLVDCGEQGDQLYSQLMLAGSDHRDARSERRDFVRACRGGTWAWLGVCIGFIGHCD